MEKLYDYNIAQAKARQKWQEENTYAPENNSGPLYSIDTPPPTVSGSLHIGHIFSYTQTDIIARYKRMNGFSVFYPFGFDDNGLPTERYVEKKRDIKAHSLGRSAFIKVCLEETHAAEGQFIDLWQRMGLSVNWESCYSTISDLARKLSQESFIILYKKGHIYRRHEPALYCTTCRTSVAQAELDDTEKPSFFNDIVFKDHQGNDLVIGTTRPELLPSCVALLFNPADERYQHLRNTQVTVPIFGFTVPVFEDEKVSIEKGTGLVMCCTFGDKTDIEWYKKFKLPYKQSIGVDGKFTQDTGFLAGLKVADARIKILEELKNQGLLLAQKPMSHSVNVHERCKKEIEFIALEQWFVRILEYKKELLEIADRVNWYPAFMKARYKDWVEHLNWDWCISRQRFFGIPFPVWHCKDCRHIIVAETKNLPVDPQETPYQASCPQCNGTNIMPDTDVMDTWNTSSITPYICMALWQKNSDVFDVANFQKFMPMSMRPQAHDIIRTWAFDTIVKVWMHHDTIPWENIVISGHVLSESKEKLSKSKDNSSLTPENLLKNHSADVIRYWTASGSLGYDSAFSENQLKIGHRLVTKLWNAFRFISEHIAQDTQSVEHELDTTNQWILHNASNCFKSYQHYFESNEFGLALQQVERFFWNDLCDNYLELVKNQLFNPQEYNPKQVAATRFTLRTIGLRILQMYAPYLPYVTETIYQELYKSSTGIASVHQTRFAAVHQPYAFEHGAQIMERVVKLTATIRKLKTEKQLSLKTALTHLTVFVPDQTLLDQVKQEEQIIRGVSQAAEIRYVIGQGQDALHGEAENWHAEVMY